MQKKTTGREITLEAFNDPNFPELKEGQFDINEKSFRVFAEYTKTVAVPYAMEQELKEYPEESAQIKAKYEAMLKKIDEETEVLVKELNDAVAEHEADRKKKEQEAALKAQQGKPAAAAAAH